MADEKSDATQNEDPSQLTLNIFGAEGDKDSTRNEKTQEYCELKEKLAKAENKIELLELIIERYREYIEQQESKTVADMKRMIDKDNPKIRELADEVRSRFSDYNPETNLLQALALVLERMARINRVRSPVTFWMDIDDVLNYNIGDTVDKAVVLCSLLRALGSEDAKVLVLEDGTQAVLFVFGGRHYVVDVEANVIRVHDPNIKKRYAFNDKEFINYEELGDTDSKL